MSSLCSFKSLGSYIMKRVCCSADGFVGRKSGKLTAARQGLCRWSETFDYKGAVGQAFEDCKAKRAEAFAASVIKAQGFATTAGPGRINLDFAT